MSRIFHFKYWNCIILATICLLLTIIWFHWGVIKGGGEEGIPFYNPVKTLQLSQTMWWDYDGGWPTLAWLPHINLFFILAFLYETFSIPNFLLQGAVIFALLFSGSISVYLLTKEILQQKNNNNSIALLSAIFYILNPFSMSQIWGRGLTPQYFTFALLPLGLLLFLRGLTKKNFIYPFFLSIASVLFSSAFGITTFIIDFWVVLGIGWLYWFIIAKGKTTKDILFAFFYFILSIFLWILTNANWLIPTVVDANKIYVAHLDNLAENIGTLLGVSQNFTPFVIIRLLQDTYFFASSAFSSLYPTILFQVISLLLPLFLCIGLFIILKKKDFHILGFFGVLFLIGLLVSSGANPPAGWLFVWVFNHVAFLQAFRNPYEKFGIVYSLGYSPVFAAGVIYFFTKRFTRRKIQIMGIFSTIFLICGMYLFPMWNGSVMTGPKVDVPNSYQHLNQLLDRTSDTTRVAFVPFWSGDGAFYKWVNTRYQGIDPTMYIVNSPTISSNPSSFPYFSDFMKSIRESIYTTDVSGALSLLRVHYLVGRRDAFNLSPSEKLHEQFLTAAIYPPQSSTQLANTLCQNKTASSSGTTNPAWIVCDITPKEGNWRNVRYLHVSVKVDKAAYLDLAVRDTQENRPRWYSTSGDEYKLLAHTWQTLLLPIGSPTEANYLTNFNNIKEIEIQAHPIGRPTESVEMINLKGITLDEGTKEDVHNYVYVKTLGALYVYKSLNDSLPPELGFMQSLERVDTFEELLTKAKEEQNVLNTHAFLLSSQNPGKDMGIVKDQYGLTIKNSSKLSNTRYIVNVKKGKGVLILSESFHPEWKVIPGIPKEELHDRFWNNLKLLHAPAISEKDHYVVNGYANAWKVNSNAASYAVVFMPQVYADIGREVSIVSVSIILVGLFFFFLRKKL